MRLLQIYQMLERMRIGTLPEKDRITASTSPYANDPKRHESITSRSTTPFNGETPLAALLSFITPTELHFKRNHLPVPDALAEAYELQVRRWVATLTACVSQTQMGFSSSLYCLEGETLSSEFCPEFQVDDVILQKLV